MKGIKKFSLNLRQISIKIQASLTPSQSRPNYKIINKLTFFRQEHTLPHHSPGKPEKKFHHSLYTYFLLLQKFFSPPLNCGLRTSYEPSGQEWLRMGGKSAQLCQECSLQSICEPLASFFYFASYFLQYPEHPQISQIPASQAVS